MNAKEREIVTPGPCLIAAAPDLLEAAELALRHLWSQQKYLEPNNCAWGHNADAGKALKNAIAKAKGEER